MKCLLLTVLLFIMGTGNVIASQLNDRDELGVSVAALSNHGWPKVYILSYNPGIPVDETTDTLIMSYGLEEVYRYKTAIQGGGVPGSGCKDTEFAYQRFSCEKCNTRSRGKIDT